jgi:tetratricopeptide (TPR) repeat protein
VSSVRPEGKIEATMSHDSKTYRIKHRTIDLDRKVRERLEGDFQREFFEAAVELDPCNIDCLIKLGDLYTRQGQFEKGLSIDRRLVGICPGEPTFHYNLACSLSLIGRLDEALSAVRDAIERGYDDWEHLERDEDLENLRKLETFDRLVEAARRED